jgi:hypothetical protein
MLAYMKRTTVKIPDALDARLRHTRLDDGIPPSRRSAVKRSMPAPLYTDDVYHTRLQREFDRAGLP